MGLYGSAPKAPAAPDPKVTAQAQTQTNISTATANALLGNVNQVTPDGNLTYTSQNKFIEDPTGGTTYWRNAAGDIQSARPMLSGTAGTPGVTTRQPIVDSMGHIKGYKNVTTGGTAATGGYDTSYSAVKGNLVPQYTATTTLSQQQQAIKDQEDAASLNLATTANKQSAFLSDYLGKGVDTSSIPGQKYNIPGAGQGIKATVDPTTGKVQYTFADAGPITRTYGDEGGYEASRKTVEDAMYARLNPQLERDRASLETSLANQGIRIGSDAYKSAMDDLNRGVSDQRTAITLAAGQEQSRLAGLDQAKASFQNQAQQQQFGQDYTRAQFNNAAQGQEYDQNLSSASFQNQAQQQRFGQNAANAQFSNAARESALSQAYAARNQPINEITALMNGAQVQQPNFVNSNMPTIPTTDYAGLVQSNYANKMAAYQQQMASQNSMIGGLFGLGSAAIMASDRRLKTDVKLLGRGPLNLAVYAFRYAAGGGRHVGVMAQDVVKVLPEAVVRMADGFLAVDYRRLFAEGGR